MPCARFSARGRIFGVLKAVANAAALAIAALPAATCRCEARLTTRSELFLFWGQALALVPGLPGKLLRRGFYALTLRSCSMSCEIEFLTHIHDRRAEIGERVYLGVGARVGCVRLEAGCLIGSRASVLNGSRQHELGPDGRLTPFDRSQAQLVRIGEETWIGEGAIIMADVGSRCIIGAGSVVSQPIPDGCLIAGNPARFVRRLVENGPNPAPTIMNPRDDLP